jgi:hypothetical protein
MEAKQKSTQELVTFFNFSLQLIKVILLNGHFRESHNIRKTDQ